MTIIINSYYSDFEGSNQMFLYFGLKVDYEFSLDLRIF